MAATVEEIAKHGFVLTPGRYVGAEELEDDGEPFAEMYPKLVGELEEHFNESEQLTTLIRSLLSEVVDAS
jgi:type I restriction enzyme M protein